MKILWFADKQFDTAPDKTTWIEIIKHLQKKNDVYLVTGYKKNKVSFNELNNEIIYISCPKIPFVTRALYYFNQIKNFYRLIEFHKPEILVFNSNNFFLIKKASKLKKECDVKSFLDVRSIPVYSEKVKYFIDKIFFKRSLKIASTCFDGITYITDEMKKYCWSEFDLPEHKSEIWTSGVDINLFKSEKKGNGKKKFRLIYHGTITKNRGLDNVIKALALLREYDVGLFLLGAGDAIAGLKSLTHRLGLEDKILFHSQVLYREVPAFIRDSDVGVLPFPNWPGWNTSSPIKMFEYLSCGKPVIATEIPAHVNVLHGKDFVFWVKEPSPEGFALAIKDIYDRRNDFRKKSQEIRNFVIKNYTWESQAEKLEEFMIG